MAAVGTGEAYAIAVELSTIIPEVTNSPHILNMVARLVELLRPISLTGDGIQDVATMSEDIAKFEEALSEAKALKAKAAEQALEEFVDRGISKAKVGAVTVHTVHVLRASIPAPKLQEACTAIIEHAEDDDAGPTELVKFTVNAQSLTAWVRERPRTEDDMPIIQEWLQPFITVYSAYETRTRKG